ncbi:MAG: GAF domain-containing protein [Chthonomonadales bacterium]|nr:GAF domain-containing protein [Chthonomonadales bacterium]
MKIAVQLAALAAVAEAAARAEGCREVAQACLAALVEVGAATSGVVEIACVPPIRCGAGVEEPAEAPPHGSARAAVGISVPTRAAPAASLTLVMPSRRSPRFLSAVASQLATAIDRAHLVEQDRETRRQAGRPIREVTTLYEIGRAIDSVGTPELLNLITERAAKVMDAQACSLMRLNPDTLTLTIAASFGLSEDVVFVTQRPLGEGIAGRVAQTGQPILIVEPDSDPRLSGVALRPEIGSSMVVPMKDEESRVIGVMCIRRRSPAPDFTEDDLRLFSVVALQAALALTNKQLYDNLRRRVSQLSTLASLTRAVMSHGDLNSLLERVADSIVGEVKLDRCCIYLQDRHTQRFVPRILRGYRPEVIGRKPVRLGEGVVGGVAREKAPIVETDARNASQPIRGFARSLGTSAFLAIPIMAKGVTIGAVVADNKTSGRPIHPDLLELLTTFANQAALAIETAQLYEDREQRYQEMNRLATQTDNILRSIAASVVVVDAGGRVIRWNKASEEMWGVAEEKATGDGYSRLVDRFDLPIDEAQRVRALMRQVVTTGKPALLHNLVLHPRGQETSFNVLLSPLIDRRGHLQGAVQIMEDVTRNIRLEAEMARIRRLADIGQLAAKMAHEVRNPLSSIKGAAQLMRNEYEELVPLREFLDIIVDEVNGLSRTTTDLLDFARPMQLDLRATDLNALVERTLALLAAEFRDGGVAVSFIPDSRLPRIQADPKQIEQVMRNIAINAAQAMAAGGTLTIATSAEGRGGNVTIRFSDTGTGIAPERLEEIFQPFFTTKTKGTGLGLAIVHKIVENHGGQVAVSSRVGEGTCFQITLPRRPQMRDLPTTVRIVDNDPMSSGLPDD